MSTEGGCAGPDKMGAGAENELGHAPENRDSSAEGLLSAGASVEEEGGDEDARATDPTMRSPAVSAEITCVFFRTVSRPPLQSLLRSR